MKKYFVILSIILGGIIIYIFYTSITNSGKFIEEKESRRIPKVLFLTTGSLEGNGKISQGDVVAIQAFSRHGAFVWLDTRDVLLQPDVLSKYSIMIILTSMGYHDGDRKYSLTYLSDFEIQNIMNWVKSGGILVTEENIGRNTLSNIDRTDISGELNPETWKLSELFGIKMKEKNLNGFSIEEKDMKAWNGRIKEKSTEDEWSLIPTEIFSDKLKILAEWTNGNEKIPAIIMNEYGKGKAYLFTCTYLLHPSNDGGISSIEQIENFYDNVFNSTYNNNKKFDYELNPWPNGYSTAFCISFNSEGEDERYNRIINFLKEEKLAATFFIDSSLSSERRKILEENENIILQSNLFSKSDFSKSDFSEITRELLMNEQNSNRKFSGLRFPLSKTNFWGLLYADAKGYIYESSIGVDHLTRYSGSVFPYNIPLAQNSYFKTLQMLEISPVNNDDKFYFRRAVTETDYVDDVQRNDARLYEKYLMDFYNYAIQKYNGLIVYIGHPKYTGYSEITLQPLKKLVDTLRTKNCWMTTLEEVANYRNKLKDLSIVVTESDDGINLKIHLPNDTLIKTLSLKLKSKPEKIIINKDYDLREVNGIYYLSFDARNEDEVRLSY